MLSYTDIRCLRFSVVNLLVMLSSSVVISFMKSSLTIVADRLNGEFWESDKLYCGEMSYCNSKMFFNF